MPRTYFRSLEKELISKGANFVCGVDEAGRGCLAGPLSMAMVLYDEKLAKLKGLNDSKLVSKTNRSQLFSDITHNFIWAHTFVDVDIIDSAGLTAAIYSGFKNLIKQIENKVEYSMDYILMDGKQNWKLACPTMSIIGGDGKIRSIAAASIIAKVKRDKLMQLIAAEFPEYGFENHVGYGTREHRSALMKYGVTGLHRKSFSPVKELL